MIRLLKMAVYAAFVVVFVVFSFLFVKNEIIKDKTFPVIEIENEVLDVKLDAKDKDLLKGVTAHDKKDGDLTDKIIVESISKFTETGTCKVTYAVCDSDNHVSSATRKIRYKGYTSPKFYMNRSLCYSLYEKINVSEVLGAKDVLDGDITGNIVTTSSDFENGKIGAYTLKVKVSNSKGDIVEIALPLIIEDRSLNAPMVNLTKYMIYVKKGEKPNFRKYFKNAYDSFEQSVSGSLRIDTDFNRNKEGIYSVHYYVKDSIERQGHAVLTVVVQ